MRKEDCFLEENEKEQPSVVRYNEERESNWLYIG